MRRRAVLGLVPALVLGSMRAFGQGQARIGWLTIAPHPGIEGFRKGMSDFGWIEGVTLTIDYAYADGRPERLADLARALASGPAQVIVASGSDAVAAARVIVTAKPACRRLDRQCPRRRRELIPTARQPHRRRASLRRDRRQVGRSAE